MAYATAAEFGGPTGYLKQLDVDDPSAKTLVEGILDRATAIVDGVLQFSFGAYAEGTIRKTSGAGHGTCQKWPIRASGRAARMISGASISW